jgi:hypothetical protein
VTARTGHTTGAASSRPPIRSRAISPSIRRLRWEIRGLVFVAGALRLAPFAVGALSGVAVAIALT